jgi:hypothetical protein
MANGARQERRTQLFFLEGAMDDFRDNFDTHASFEGLTPEQVEAMEKGLQVAESMFEDIVEAVKTFGGPKRTVNRQKG